MKKMEWYVLWHDFNKDRIEAFNIFRSAKVMDEKFGIPKLLKNYITYDNFKEELERLFKYAYHSKAEYEIKVSGIHDFNKEYKIDIWEQIEPNLDLIARYIIEEHNKKIDREEEE